MFQNNLEPVKIFSFGATRLEIMIHECYAEFKKVFCKSLARPRAFDCAIDFLLPTLIHLLALQK